MDDTVEKGAIPAQRTLTPVFIVAYLAVHFLWRQFIFGPYSFVILRCLLFAGLIAFLVYRKRGSELGHYFIGRLLRDKQDWLTAFEFLLCIVVGRFFDRWFLHSTVQTATFSRVFDDCVIAPINEEILFRGIFLSILLDHMPGKEKWAVFLATLIFISMHSDLTVGWAIAVLILGQICGYSYLSLRSIPVCILCHALWNAFAFISLP